MASRNTILSLYRNMLKESKKFDGYNYRRYALRRIHDAFKENKSVQDAEQVQVLIKKAESNLEVIKRQVSIGQMYSAPKLVIETMK